MLCFSLLELDDALIKQMMELVFELLCQGDLSSARILRKKLIEKCEARKVQAAMLNPSNVPLSAISVTSR